MSKAFSSMVCVALCVLACLPVRADGADETAAVPNTPALKATFKWDDRRPIGAIFLANSGQNWPLNPRGYFNDPTMDVNSDAGKAKLRSRLMKLADDSIAAVKDVGGQGVIVWDIEGGEMPHAITYLGDPRCLPQVAPEMDEIADGFFKRFRDAGLKVGVCIRPSRIIFKDPSDPAKYPWIKTRYGHIDDGDPVDTLSDKIAYAQKRWGCSIFYMDTNYTPSIVNGKPERSKDGVLKFRLLSAAEIQELHRRHPDVLVWPEFQTVDYFASSSGYREFSQVGDFSADVRKVYPSAFRVWMPRLNAEDVYRAWDEFIAKGIMSGEVFLFEGSPRANAYAQALKNATDEGAMRAAVASAGPMPAGDAAKLLSHSDATVRWRAIETLERRRQVADQSALISQLQQETRWPVLRRSVESLASFTDEPATAALAGVLQHDTSGLGFFAACSLGRQGTPQALAALVAALHGQGHAPVAAALGLGASGKPQAVALLTPLLEKQQAPSLRWAALDALGDLRQPAAVDPLLNYLKTLYATQAETSRQKTVIALGKIGDRRAAAPLLEALASKEFTRQRTVICVALQKITGVGSKAGTPQDLKAWQNWLAQK